MHDRLAQVAKYAAVGATGRDRGTIYPYAEVVLSFIVFVPVYVGLHYAWPTVYTTARDGTSYQPALDAIGWWDAFMFPILPFLYLALTFAYLNIRVSRDTGRFA